MGRKVYQEHFGALFISKSIQKRAASEEAARWFSSFGLETDKLFVDKSSFADNANVKLIIPILNHYITFIF